MKECWKPLKTPQLWLKHPASSGKWYRHCTDGLGVKLTSKLPRSVRKKHQKTHLINPQSLVEKSSRFVVSMCQLLEVRFALISYRDHPPQERTYVTQSHPFTEDVETMRGPLIHPMEYGQRWTRGQEPSWNWDSFQYDVVQLNTIGLEIHSYDSADFFIAFLPFFFSPSSAFWNDFFSANHWNNDWNRLCAHHEGAWWWRRPGSSDRSTLWGFVITLAAKCHEDLRLGRLTSKLRSRVK